MEWSLASALKTQLEFRPFLTSLGTSGSSRSRRDDDCDPRSRSRRVRRELASGEPALRQRSCRFERLSNKELDDPDVPPKGPALNRRGFPTQGYVTIRSHELLRLEKAGQAGGK